MLFLGSLYNFLASQYATRINHFPLVKLTFQGLDKTYYYGSLYIQTNPAPEGDRISAVWFADDSITTAEGVYIGADRAAVEKAYGSFSGDACTLDRDGQRLMILLESGVVSSIQYTLAQE